MFFYGCNSLENITIPFVGASLDGTDHTHFGYLFGAESYLDNKDYVPDSLQEVVVLDGQIAKNAFYGCDKLISVVIGEAITIGSSAFYGCKSLTSITFPKSLKSVGSNAFEMCGEFLSVYYEGNIINWCEISFADSDANPLRYALYIDDTIVTEVIINGGSSNIGDYVFYGYSKLTSVKINNIDRIGEFAFAFCNNLADVSIGNGVTTIGSQAFNGCTSLWRLSISDSVSSIENYAFTRCTRLGSVTIGSGVTKMGYSVFAECKNLSYAQFKNSNGWFVYFGSSTINISSDSLSDPFKAAKLLTSTYIYYYWERT